jgi:hypothetical protein
MNRVQVVQGWLNRFPQGTYLEIGVQFGLSFAPARTRRKIAVDPRIRMPRFARRIAARRAAETHYFETTSDCFFAEQAGLLGASGIDVALIDGLHTHEQTVVDVENTLRWLTPGGLIVMHDCNPQSAAQACPAASYEQFRKRHWGSWFWCGDVWKTILYLRACRKDLEVLVLDCDFGVGIVRRGQPHTTLDLSAEAIRGLTYDDLARDRQRLLNLQPARYYHEFFHSR